MKYKLLFYLLLMVSIAANSQDSGVLDLQKAAVGYCNVVLYDNGQRYNEYGYEGPWPMFVDVWFPLQSAQGPALKFGDFQLREIPELLQPVYDELTKNLDESIIRDALSAHIETDEELDFGGIDIREVLNWMKALDTRSIKADLPQNMDCPVIVYHHGSRGQSYENHLMAEYFASKGYVFISSNFHLPYPETLFGLLPYRLEAMNRHNQSAAKTLIHYGRELCSNNNIYYIGHSWGAQEGWCFLNESGWADAFVSLETTIPFKSDPAVIKEYWPQVYAKLVIQQNRLEIPALVIEATETDEIFPFFENAANENTWHVSSKKYFAHNSYTSIYLMRNFMNDRIMNADSLALQTQYQMYLRHLHLIDDFLANVAAKEKWEHAEFDMDFYINAPLDK